MDAFEEKQNFMKSWWMLMVIPALVGFAITVLVGVRTGEGRWSFLVGPVILFAVFLMFIFLELHTRITDQGISVRFGFFQRKYKTYLWSEIVSAEIVKYDPLFEYGGWGYRTGWKKKKIAYNVSGNMGLKIILKDGRMIMVGSKDHAHMKSYLQYLSEKYHISALRT